MEIPLKFVLLFFSIFKDSNDEMLSWGFSLQVDC